MKKLLFILLVPLACFAQNPPMSIPFPGVPSGACASGVQTATNTSNGDFYSCSLSAWVKVSGGGGGTPGGTNGQIQYNNAGHFGGDTCTTDGSGDLICTTVATGSTSAIANAAYTGANGSTAMTPTTGLAAFRFPTTGPPTYTTNNIAEGYGASIPPPCNDSSGSGTTQVCSTPYTFTPGTTFGNNIILYKTTTTNTGAVTLAVNGATAAAIQKWEGTALASGDLKANIPTLLAFDGTNWQMLTAIGNAPASGAAAFNALTGGTNTTATMLVGSGAVLEPTTGIVSANDTGVNGSVTAIPTSAAVVGTNSTAGLVADTGHNLSTVFACADSSGSGTAQSCTPSPAFSPASGDMMIYTTTTTNTGALTLAVNGGAAAAVQKWEGTALVSGDLKANTPTLLGYDGTHWQMLSLIGNAPATGSALSSITAATGTNSINSGNNAQTWNWALTGTTTKGFTLTENSASTGGTALSQILHNIATIAGSTAVPLGVSNSLTGSQTLPALYITPTWNTTGVVDAGILENVTNTASGAASLLMDLQVGGTSEFKVDKAGTVTSPGNANFGSAASTASIGLDTTSGNNSLTTQSGANGVTWTLPSTTGTLADSVSSPLALSSTTGNITCTTCATTTNGGALSGTAPVAISAGGAISITGAAGQVLAGASPAFTATPTLGASGTLGSLTFGNATSGLLTLQTATGAITSYTLELPVAQPTSGNTILSCTAANPSVCTWIAGGGAGNPPLDKSASGLSNPTQDATFTYPNTSTTGFTFAGNAPASVSTTPGTTATTLFNVNGVTGGATSNATGTAGVGSAPTIAGGTGGAGTGTNAVGGAGGGISLSPGNGGASNGTGANSNGGSVTVTPGTAGTGGSGTAGKQGVLAVSGTGAGFAYFTQGASASTTNNNVPANSIMEQAPTSVTAYTLTKPGSAPTNNFSAKTVTTGGTESWNKMQQIGFSTGSYSNATTSFTAVTGLSFAVDASSNYGMSCHLYFQGSATTAGIKAEITGPSTPTAVFIGLHQPLTASTYNESVTNGFSSSVGVTTAITATTNFEAVLTMGLINGTNAGTVAVNLAAEGTGTLTLQNGSYCIMQ